MITSLKQHLLAMTAASISYERSQAIEHHSIFPSASSKISEQHDARAKTLQAAFYRISHWTPTISS